MRICIIQSCYIPWKGFFELIGLCDEYVIYDSAQYVKRHWHNRNRIKTPSDTRWLTIPVMTKGRYRQRLDQVEIDGPWAEQHWKALERNYKQAACFGQLAPMVKAWYEQAEKQTRLTEVNEIFLRGIAGFLGLKTRIERVESFHPGEGTATERLLKIAQQAGADRYLSGPSARDYFDETVFTAAGVMPEWMNYENYPEYPQLHGGFEHAVTSLDLIFNTGHNASRYLKRLSPPAN